jgi:tetratricopeptide (TPR) repeat protein
VTSLGETAASLRDALQGRYTIERELGRGGMATVYLAEDLRLHRRVALKVLSTEVAATLGPDRFQREIRLAAGLFHPHILSVFESGEAGGRLWYAMPYVKGESLRQRLQREGQLAVEEVLRIAIQVAGALDLAHQRGIVHRDIKPENILLDGEQALVADFGIARALDSAGGEQLTAAGVALGTPAYMSPEQATASPKVDGRADVYALGCVVYEMLAGAPPFTGPTAKAIMARHAVDPVPPLHTVRTTISEHIERAITRALAKVPADRFTSAGEFAAALATQPEPKLRPRLVPWIRHRNLALGVAAAIAVVSSGALVLRQRAFPTVLPAAATVAVFPFRSPDGDTALARLGRDLSVTVTASLDGVGGIATTDGIRVAHETAERPAESPAEAAAIARRLGARSALHGTAIRDGEWVRLDLGLFDAANVAPLAQGITITAHRDSVAALTDSVVWVVLRQVWRRGRPPTPSLEAVTTRSIPALRAFLDGERAVDEGRWDDASLAFSAAIAADSAFWLAYFRQALAEAWQERPMDPRVAETLYRHRDAFPARERLLLEGWWITGSDDLERIDQQREIEIYQEVTRRYPDYWPGWLFLGDRLFHSGILLGFDWTDVQGVLGRAVGLNPRLRPAWEHLFQNSVGKDTLESGRVLARILEVPIRDPVTEEGKDEAHLRRVWRLNHLIARSGGVIPPAGSTLADSVIERWVSLDATPWRRRPGPWGVLAAGFPAAQIDWSRRLLRLGPRSRYAANQHRAMALAWAQRGAWDSALVAMRSALDVAPDPRDPNPPTPLDDYGLAVLGAWLGALDPSIAARRRAAAGAGVEALSDSARQAGFRATLAWLEGIEAFTTLDSEALERARRSARASGSRHTWFVDQSLAAFGTALAGGRAKAGRDLASLDLRCARYWTCGGPGVPEIWISTVAIHRLAAATWLLEAGDTTQAARLLTWHETGWWFGWEWSHTLGVTALAYLMRARIEEAQGQRRAAMEHYQQFLRRYDAEMPAQRHLVDEARAALTRLEGRVDPSPNP